MKEKWERKKMKKKKKNKGKKTTVLISVEDLKMMERTGNVLGVVTMMGRQQIMLAVTDVNVGFALLATGK